MLFNLDLMEVKTGAIIRELTMMGGVHQQTLPHMEAVMTEAGVVVETTVAAVTTEEVVATMVVEEMEAVVVEMAVEVEEVTEKIYFCDVTNLYY